MILKMKTELLGLGDSEDNSSDLVVRSVLICGSTDKEVGEKARRAMARMSGLKRRDKSPGSIRES